MLEYHEMIFEYGLIGLFDTICMMKGEELAVIQDVETMSENSLSEPSDNSSENDSSIEHNGISYIEVQDNYISISLQLYHRFGFRRENKDFACILCKGNVGAEITSILACIRIGLVFIPLDESWIDQIDKMSIIIRDCNPSVLIICANSDKDPIVIKFNELYNIHKFIFVDENGSLIPEEYSTCDIRSDLPDNIIPKLSKFEELFTENIDLDPLYIIYTSGSSGIPKGVLGSRLGLINRLAWQYKTFPFSNDDIVCRRTPLTFIDGITELFGPLLSGIPLWWPSKDIAQSGGIISIVTNCLKIGVTRITLIPSQLAQLLSISPNLLVTNPKSLRMIIISGEECTLQLLESYKAHYSTCCLLNLYGSTEVTGDVTYAILHDPNSSVESIVSHESIVTIGNVIDNNLIFIVRELEDINGPKFEMIEDDSPGELIACGFNVAIEYYCNSVLTAEKFIPLSDDILKFIIKRFNLSISSSFDFLKSTLRLFRTGDIVMRNPKGNYFWIGRKDRQVKVYGLRIELEDLERKLSILLDNCQVVVYYHNILEQIGGKELIAVLNAKTLPHFIEASSHHVEILQAVNRLVASKGLKLTILPNTFMIHSEFPKTTSGKMDRVELFNLLFKGENKLKRGYHSINEDSILGVLHKFLSDIFGEKFTSISGFTSLRFLELGGDSMTIIEFLWKIKSKYLIPLNVDDIKTKTIAELSDLIQSRLPTIMENSITTTKRRSIDENIIQSKKACEIHLSNSRKYSLISRTSDRYFNIETTSSIGLSIAWSNLLQKCVDASPILLLNNLNISNSIVIIGSHFGDMSAFLQNDGSLVWTVCLNSHVESEAAYSSLQSLVFVSSYAGKDRDGHDLNFNNDKLGFVSSINIEAGDIIWQTSFQHEVKATCCVIDDMNILVVGTYGRSVEILRIHDGSFVGSVACNGPVYATPLVSRKKNLGNDVNSDITSIDIYIVTIQAEIVLAEILFNKLHKTYNFTCKWKQNLGFPIYANPLFIGNERSSDLILATVEGAIICMTNEIEKWKLTTRRPMFSTPAILGDSSIVVGSHDGILRCCNGKDGTILWEEDLEAVIFSSPLILNLNCNYGFDLSLAVVATTAGDIFLVTLKDDHDGSRILHRIRLPGEIYSSPIAFQDDTNKSISIFVGCRDDRLYKLILVNSQ